jgi:hypothetical protein
MSINCASTANSFQDDFVLKIFNYKKNGFFVDIGCGVEIDFNNTYRLELNGWNGLRVDSELKDAVSTRSSLFILDDALNIDYKSVLESMNCEKIDYASFDIDEATTNLIKIFPFEKYKPSVITIEHDRYRLGDSDCNEQREILSKHNYHLLCKDVLVDTWIGWTKAPYEDWWVNAEMFDTKLLDNLQSEFISGAEILKKFGLSSVDFSNL